MFRKIKKKPVAQATKRTLQVEEENTDGVGPVSLAEQEELGENPSVLLQKKKQRRTLKSGIRTGAVSTTTTTTTNRTSKNHHVQSATGTRTTVRVQKRPRAAGVGYGGGGITAASVGGGAPDGIRLNPNFTVSAASEGVAQPNRYDAASLSQLRQQQDVFPKQHHGTTSQDGWEGQPIGSITMRQDSGWGRNENPGVYYKANDDDNHDDDDNDDYGMGRNFIPIDDNVQAIHGTVLSGDDALAYTDDPVMASQREQAQFSRTMDSVLGGVQGGSFVPAQNRPSNMNNERGTFQAYNTTSSPTRTSSSSASRTLTLHDVHQQFSQTQERLKQQADEMEKSVLRRQEAKQETQAEIDKHRQNIKTTGSSLEFYQSWRRDLIAFVGALREITLALPDMQAAWHELEQDMAGIQKWKEWEDDTFAILTRYQIIQSVVGRQPHISADLLTDGNTEVDEFGRDIVSQKQRILEQRRVERRKIRKEAVVENGVKRKMGAWSGPSEAVPPHLNNEYAYPTGYPVLVGPKEMETFRERFKALQDALKVVLDNLYEEYTSLPQLFDLFAQWKRRFPSEYKECYASLTLADLATVLILVELLSLNNPLNESGGHDEAKWVTIVCRYYDCGESKASGSLEGSPTEMQLFDKEAIERLVSKAVLPTLQDILSGKHTYNLLSSRQGMALSSFFSHARRLLSGDHPVLRILHKVVVDYVEVSLRDVSVPLVAQQDVALERLNQVSDPHEKELLTQTIHDATIGQLERVKKIVLTLFDCWATMLPPESGFPSVLLHFISSTVVPLLSCLKTWYWPSLAESPSDIFGQIWKEIQKYDWLDRPENMIHSTVLRATATALHVDQQHAGDNTVMGDLASDPVLNSVGRD